MDIATYNQMEALAQARLSSWRFEQTFSPLAFEQVGFPARIGHFGQIRGLLSGMHSLPRVSKIVAELGGIRDEDLSRIARAVAVYIKWYRSNFPDVTVPIPFGDVMAYYLAYTKLHGIAGRSRVLEVGPGYGLMSMFVSGDPAIETYDTIEITQSLYVLQASIGRHCFDESFRSAALPADDPAPVGRIEDDSTLAQPHHAFSLKMGRQFRSTLYPWWQIDEPLGKRYDVIVSNSNLREMAPEARRYYLGNWRRALADDGYVLVQDLGHRVQGDDAEIMQELDARGYRALAKYFGDHGSKHLHMWNLLLVTERHPDYAQARPLSDSLVLVADNETVRRVYGLDRPAGRTMSVTEILKQAVAKVGRQSA